MAKPTRQALLAARKSSKPSSPQATPIESQASDVRSAQHTRAPSRFDAPLRRKQDGARVWRSLLAKLSLQRESPRRPPPHKPPPKAVRQVVSLRSAHTRALNLSEDVNETLSKLPKEMPTPDEVFYKASIE